LSKQILDKTVSPGKNTQLAHQSAPRGFGISDKQKNQNHPQERNQPSNNHDGIENVGSGALAKIRVMADQLEGNDGTDTGGASTESADAGD